jgi:long-chain acyl-CoA synthetase
VRQPAATPGSGNLADLVRAAAERRPDGPAFLYRGTTTTWSEVDAAVDAAAAGLLGLGLVPGDRVGIHLGNTLEFPLAYFGVLRAGLVAVPLNPGYTRDELTHALGDSGACALITTRSSVPTAQLVAAELDALEHLVVTGVDSAPPAATTWDALLDSGSSRSRVESAGGGEDLAVVI